MIKGNGVLPYPTVPFQTELMTPDCKIINNN